MHSVSHWQTVFALLLHTCEVTCTVWGLCSLTCSLNHCLSPQGFDDQPGVEPQRLFPAQRRHHLVQPVTVQLHDLQVETGRWGLQPPLLLPPTLQSTQSQPPSCPSSSSLDSVPLAQPVYGTEACLHKQKTKNFKKSEAKRKNRLCVQLKGWFLHKGHIFFVPGICAGAAVWIRTLAECLCRVSCWREGDKLRRRCSSGSWKKQYSHPGSYGTRWRHWRLCYIYAFTLTPTCTG